MRISDVQSGKTTLLELKPLSSDDFGAVDTLLEVELYSSDLESEALLRAGKTSWAVDGIDSHQRGLLSGVLLRSLPRVAWIAARRPKDSKVPARSLVVEVREFPSGSMWPDPVDLGVNDRVVELVRKKRKSLSSIADVIAWLEERVLITGSAGSSRVLLSGSHTSI